MESLTKPELLMLFSILEGELEARDLVIDALKVPLNEAGNIIMTFKWFSVQNLSFWYQTLTPL